MEPFPACPHRSVQFPSVPSPLRARGTFRRAAGHRQATPRPRGIRGEDRPLAPFRKGFFRVGARAASEEGQEDVPEGSSPWAAAGRGLWSAAASQAGALAESVGAAGEPRGSPRPYKFLVTRWVL